MKCRIVALLLLSVNVVLATPVTISQASASHLESTTPKVFLGGSLITPWRDRITTLLRTTDYTLFNPAHPPTPGRIDWEQTHINQSDILVMWIAKNSPRDPYSLSLTSLFELGRFAEMKHKTLFVGIDPDYAMRDELVLQLRRLRPELTLYDSVDSLATALKMHWQNIPSPARAAHHRQEEPLTSQAPASPIAHPAAETAHH